MAAILSRPQCVNAQWGREEQHITTAVESVCRWLSAMPGILVLWYVPPPINESFNDIVMNNYNQTKTKYNKARTACTIFEMLYDKFPLIWYLSYGYSMMTGWISISTLQWSHNGCYDVSNHQSYDCLRNRLYRRRSKKTSKLRVTGFCAGNSPVCGEFPTQMASNAENVPIWLRHHDVFVQ